MKVGDYVRTKKKTFRPPQIARIKSMERDSGYHNQYYIKLDHNLIPDYEFCIYEEDIEKSSSNIIDLIEEDDFINGSRISELKSNKNGVIKCMLDSDYEFITTIINEEIESVVTKEQFESMEYKVC